MLHIINRRFFKSLSLVIILMIGLSVISVYAESDPNPDSNYPVEVTVSATSVPADGVSKITVNLFIYGYKCVGEEKLQETPDCSDGTRSVDKVALPNRWIGVYTTGTGNIYTNLNTPVGVQYVTSGSDGRASFQMASTVAETKNLQFCDHVRGVAPSGATAQTIAFTPVPHDTVASSITEPPVLNQVKVDDHEVSTDEQLVLTANQRLTLSGTASPGSTVTLEVNSEPLQSVNVDVNSNGIWTHEFSDFQQGTFSIKGFTKERSKADPSIKVTLVSFSVTEKSTPAVSTGQQKRTEKNKFPVWISALLVLIIALCGRLIYVRRGQIKQHFKAIKKSK